ncbi:MAG TPA: translocation/assembly module TamB domain-containing protein [Armatimonadota bacterium]|nr:translocation/assembly module TamB domain-containing protein [Armatimonadota bacterium]
MHRLWKILVILLPLLVIVAAGVAALSGKKLAARLRPVVESQLSQTLGREVRVGGISGGLLRGAVLHDVTIADGKRPQGGVLARAKRVAVRYHLRPLLSGGKGSAAAIDRVSVTGARVELARDRGGRWNIASLFKPRVPPARRFTGVVTIADSTLVFTDQSPPAPVTRSLQMRLVNLSGRLTPDPRRGLVFRLSAQVADGGMKRIAVAGSSDGKRTVLHVAAADVNLADWGTRLAMGGVHLLGGSADVNVTGAVAKRDARWVFDYVARARVRDATLRLGRGRELLRSVTGPLIIAGGRLRLLGVTGTVGGAQFAASGSIGVLSAPQLDLRISTDHLALETAARMAGFRPPAGLQTAPISLDLAVRGSFLHPFAQGTVRSPRVRYRGVAVNELATKVSYRDGKVWLRGMRLRAQGGAVSGDGWLKLERGATEVAFEVWGRDLDLGGLVSAARAAGLAVGAPAAGRAPLVVTSEAVAGTVNAHVAGTWDARGLRAAGSFEARDGRIGDLRFSAAAGAARLERGELQVASARIDSPAGTAVVRGAIGADGTLDLQVVATELDLAALTRLVGARSEVGGVGYFSGTLSGSLADPTASGRFEALDAEYAGQRFDLLSGAATASRKSLTADGLLAYQAGTRYAVSGSLTGLDRPRDQMGVAGRVEVSYAPLAELLARAGIEADVEGRVEASVEIGGTLGEPTAQGWVRLYRPMWRGIAGDYAQARFDLAGGVARISEARAQAGESQLTAAGEITTHGELRLTYSADVQLADLPPRASLGLPLDVSGRVTASGEIGGTVRRPLLTADARCERIAIGAEVLTEATAQARPGDPPQHMELRLSFAQGPARYQAAGWADIASRTVQLEASITGGRLGRLRSALQAMAERFPPDSVAGRVGQAVATAPSPVRGNLDLQATVSGPWRAPLAEVGFQVSDASIAGAPIPDVTAAVNLRRHALEVRRFEARRGAAYAMASGTVELDGELALEVDAYNVRAELLEPWLGLKRQVSGSADLSASVGGTMQRPTIVGSIEVADLAAGGLRVEHLRVSRFEVQGDSLVADDVVVALGPHVVHASCAVPITWRPLGIDAARPLSAALNLEGQDLALLARVAPAVAESAGALDGRVVMGGTLRRPELFGAIKVSHGTVKLRAPQVGVRTLEGSVRFEGRRVLVEGVTGLVGDGAFKARGEVGLVSLRPSQLMSNRFDLTFAGAGLDLDFAPLFVGKVDADLALASPPQADTPPAVRGRVLLASGDLGLPPRGALRPLAQSSLFDPLLAINVEFDPNLWLRTPTMSMQVSGNGHIGGRLTAPVATATLESRRGTVDLPVAHFRVSYASLDATVSSPSAPGPGLPPAAEVRVVMRLDAEANVRGYRVYLAMSGPLTDPNAEPLVELRSVPALDEQRLWALVTGLPLGTVTSELGSSTSAVVTTGLGGVVLYPLERALASALGLQEFGVEYNRYEPLRVRVGGYVLEHVYVTYLRSVSADIREWDFVLAYEVLPSVALGARINERNELLWEGQTTWRF